LSIFLGGLGIDRFYLGYIGTGLIKLFTFGGFGIWSLVDLIMIFLNKKKSKNGLSLKNYEVNRKFAIILFVIMILLYLSGIVVAAINFYNSTKSFVREGVHTG